jgi:hypothetical protein
LRAALWKPVLGDEPPPQGELLGASIPRTRSTSIPRS